MIELLESSPVALGGDLASGVHTLLRDAFPEDAPGEGDYYRTHGAPRVVIILREAPHVIAHLALYQRQMNIGNETLEIGMLGGIVVAPERRRRGHSRVLVRRAHEQLKARNIPFSILFACKPRVYEASGYKLMQKETHFIDIDGTSKTLVFRGSMYAELLQKRWPNQLLDLCGRVV